MKFSDEIRAVSRILAAGEEDRHCTAIKNILDGELQSPITCEYKERPFKSPVTDGSFIYHSEGHLDREDESLGKKLTYAIDKYFKSQNASSETSYDMQEQGESLVTYDFETVVRWS